MQTQTVAARAIIPTLRYEDAPRAIEFLCDAFGFERNAVYAADDGKIEHAQLNLGSHTIMLGSVRPEDEWANHTPRELGGATAGIYVVLESDADVDAHYARAKAGGAKIIRELESPDYGGRNYSATDLEGHPWSFGSYRPESE